MTRQYHFEPGSYDELIRREVRLYDELQRAAIDAIPFAPRRALELGIGTGATTRRLLEAYPEAEVTGLDASPEMVFAARELAVEVRLSRMEDPLPDGPWDLVIAVLTVHHLRDEQKRDLLRRVRAESRSLVIGDVVAADPQSTPVDPEIDFPCRAEELAGWADGEVVWTGDDLAVVRAVYD